MSRAPSSAKGTGAAVRTSSPGRDMVISFVQGGSSGIEWSAQAGQRDGADGDLASLAGVRHDENLAYRDEGGVGQLALAIGVDARIVGCDGARGWWRGVERRCPRPRTALVGGEGQGELVAG